MIHTATYPPKSSRPANGGYRYFFNGQEADNEVFGTGTLHAFEYRMHDTRVGRFWSVDPLAGKFPWNSVYAFAENSPIGFLELEGLEVVACFSNSNNDLAIIPDASKCNPSLEYKWVSAFEYSKLTDSQKKEYNYGIYVQNVFSGGHLVGDKIVKGNGGSQKEIPIPMGFYNILEYKDNDNPDHDKFFVLDPQDDKPYNKIDDRPGIINSEKEQRSGYNLHPGETSWGCVTAAKRTPEMNEYERAKEWDIIYDAIINTTSTTVPDKRGKHRFLPWEKQVKYGTLEVID